MAVQPMQRHPGVSSDAFATRAEASRGVPDGFARDARAVGLTPEWLCT